ncbi:sugar transporter [Fusarium circinatum]|uniref:Sugar transporter n=1 Tax=Fusarium circinatum TaxID=48490 RepID=A0A8H5UC22_FUSCI|nr:sugar transporter [Fusarium circinatum]
MPNSQRYLHGYSNREAARARSTYPYKTMFDPLTKQVLHHIIRHLILPKVHFQAQESTPNMTSKVESAIMTASPSKTASNEVDCIDTNRQAQAAEDSERDMTVGKGLRVYYKAVLWSAFLSLAAVMEGYDALLLSSLFGQPAFIKGFGELQSDGTHAISAAWQSAIPNAVKVGQFFGLFIAGWATDRFGFRMTVISTSIIAAALIFIQFFASTIKVLLVAQLLFGFPLGAFLTMTSVYAAEICPMVLRPYLTSWVNLCWTIGKLISAGVLRAFVTDPSHWAYRIPFATQWFWPPILLFGSLFAPESPWWFVRHGRLEGARRSLRRLRTDKDNTESIESTLANMILVNQRERELEQGTSYIDCFRGYNLRRTEIACVTWMIQPLCGFAIVGFSTYFFQQAGFDAKNSFSLSLGQQGIALVGGIIAWTLLTHFGRRTLLLWGLGGSTIFQLSIGFLGIPVPRGGVAWATGSMMMLYMLVYALTIGPTCYVVVAEMGSTRLRSKTTVLARNSYQVATVVNNILTSYMINSKAWNWRGKAGLFWGAVNILLWAYCFFRLPETKSRTFAEIDALFEAGISARKFRTFEVQPFAAAQDTTATVGHSQHS